MAQNFDRYGNDAEITKCRLTISSAKYIGSRPKKRNKVCVAFSLVKICL